MNPPAEDIKHNKDIKYLLYFFEIVLIFDNFGVILELSELFVNDIISNSESEELFSLSLSTFKSIYSYNKRLKLFIFK